MSAGKVFSANWIEADSQNWLRDQYLAGRAAGLEKYGHRLGVVPAAKPEPQAPVTSAPLPPAEDTRTPDEAVEDAEIALLIAQERARR